MGFREDLGNWTVITRVAESRGLGERAGRLRGLGGVGAHFLAGSGLWPRGEALLEGILFWVVFQLALTSKPCPGTRQRG